MLDATSPVFMRRLLSIVGFLVAVLVLWIPAAAGQDGLRGALSQSRVAFQPESFPALVAADFDGDSQPDGAVLAQSGFSQGQRLFRIELHLSAGKNSTLTFSSTEQGLSISALDVNHDGSADLVVERALTHQRLLVFVNDRYGSFQRARAEAFPAPDDSTPQWRETYLAQHLPTLFLPPTRNFELAVSKATTALLDQEVRRTGLLSGVFVVQCGARAPAAPRAPPSLLSL
jgi:hypothetical protein